MKLILARHGNTFGPDQEGGEKIIMAGCHNNLPLVEKGRQQARQLAEHLLARKMTPHVIYSSTLLRTWEYATIVREFFYHRNRSSNDSSSHTQHIPLYAHHNLMEFDYGKWSGLHTEGKTAQTNEVIAQFGEEAWENWQKKRIPPPQNKAEWKTTPEEMIHRMRLFFNELEEIYALSKDSVILAITSQGNLSFSRAICPGGMKEAIEKGELSVQTGKFCEWDWNGSEWQLIYWNQATAPNN